MKVTLHKAKPSDLPIVKNLVPYYIYDMSEFMGWATKPDGRHDGCDGMEKYWSDADKQAFILRAGASRRGLCCSWKAAMGRPSIIPSRIFLCSGNSAIAAWGSALPGNFSIASRGDGRWIF